MNLENIISQSPNYLFWKDSKSIYQGCNINFALACGFKNPQDVIGKTDYELPWKETQADLYRQCDQKVLNGIPLLNQQEPQLQANKKLVHVLFNKIPLLDLHGEKIGVIGSYIVLYELNTQQVSLTKIQTTCLFYLIKGMTCKEIAKKMNLSWRTVYHYIENIKFKLNCENKSDLICKGLELSFIKEMLLFNK